MAPIAAASGWRPGFVTIGGFLLISALLVTVLMAGERKPAAAPGRSLWSEVPVLVRNRDFRRASLGGMLAYTGQVAIYTHLSLYVLQGLGHDVGVAAIVLAALQIGAAAGRLVSGAISDRLFQGRRRLPLVLFQAGAIVVALLLAGIPSGGQPAVLVGVAALAGATMVGWNTLAVALTAESAGPERAGAAAGLSTTMLHGIATVSPPIFGLLVDASGNLRVVWLAACLALVAAIVATARVRET